MSFIFDPQRGQRPRSNQPQASWQDVLIRPPQDVGQGMTAIGNALAYRHAQRQAQFPEAPGGGNPNVFAGFGNSLKGLFGLGAARTGLY